MEHSVSLIVEHDVEFVIAMHNKYGLSVASWYWRMEPETHEEWITRRADWFQKQGFYEGILLVKDMNISYSVPLPCEDNTWTEIHITNVDTGKHTSLTVAYSNLYTDLEQLIQHELSKV